MGAKLKIDSELFVNCLSRMKSTPVTISAREVLQVWKECGIISWQVTEKGKDPADNSAGG